MKQNDVVKVSGNVLRVLEIREDEMLVINCETFAMPYWMKQVEEYEEVELTEEKVERTDKKARERFTMISTILPVVGDELERSERIREAAAEFGVSKQTVRKYLCRYLVYQCVECLGIVKGEEKELSKDQKNFRWALNKFFYTPKKNTLQTAYKMMLKHKYCDANGELLANYPSFTQFRYFYRKTRNEQNYYISRNGMKDYQKNHRPLIGGGVQNFVSGVGTYMLDSTICDIYLVSEEGRVIGRPILTAAVDAYSGLCVGYALGWEGGVYSLRELMLNVVEDKVEHCRKYGVLISEDEWSCKELGGRMMTDMGREYASDTFAQLAELGITITNIQPYRPDLKACVERFFQSIQNLFKPH